MERKLAAILFTDVVDYTALMGRDEAAGRRVRPTVSCSRLLGPDLTEDLLIGPRENAAYLSYPQ